METQLNNSIATNKPLLHAIMAWLWEGVDLEWKCMEYAYGKYHITSNPESCEPQEVWVAHSPTPVHTDYSHTKLIYGTESGALQIMLYSRSDVHDREDVTEINIWEGAIYSTRTVHLEIY
jgi:hypothetical protein